MCEADLDPSLACTGTLVGRVGREVSAGSGDPRLPPRQTDAGFLGAALRGCAGWHVRPISAPCLPCLLPLLSSQPLLLLTSSLSPPHSFSLVITPTLCLSLSWLFLGVPLPWTVNIWERYLDFTIFLSRV